MVRETTLSSSVSATAISLGETASTNSVSRLSRKPPALLCTTTCQEHPTAWISLLRSLGERFRSRTGEDLSQLIRSKQTFAGDRETLVRHRRRFVRFLLVFKDHHLCQIPMSCSKCVGRGNWPS